MPIITAAIITKNEADDIRACLESIKWVDEIIVLDSGSTDDTVAICREYTDNVFETDWPGFGPQKNRAIDKATGDWVLAIDADETISDALRDEIKAAIGNAEHTAYDIPRISNYCGRKIRYGNWRNDRVIRLFKHGRARYNDVPVHESLIVDGKIGHLNNPLQHDSFKNLEEVLEKMNRYSTYSAQLKKQHGKKSSLTRAIFSGLWTFFYSYFIKLGILDGREGFMLAVSNAEGAYYRYAKLMLLDQVSHRGSDPR